MSLVILHCLQCLFSTGLDRLSYWLRNDEHFGYAVLFCLIFITTFRMFRSYFILGQKFTYMCRCFSHFNSPSPTVFHADHIIGIYVWAVDRRCYLVLCCALWCYRRVLAITDVFARANRSVAFLNARFMPRGPSRRTQAATIIPRQTRTIPV